MGLDTAIATLAVAKSLLGLAPVAGPVLVGIIDAGTEICKAVQVRGSYVVGSGIASLMLVPEREDKHGTVPGTRGARLAALLYACTRLVETRACSELRAHHEDTSA
jgi:hypothetical protein